MQLDVFQYAAAAADIPEKPHRFRGLWTRTSDRIHGDWYFCPYGEAPRQVGSFAAAIGEDSLPPSAVTGEAARIAAAEREDLMSSLDVYPAPEDDADPLAPFTVGSVPTVQYVPEWISTDQEEEFIRMADTTGAWEAMSTRSTQEWGAGGRSLCGRGLVPEPLLPWLEPLAEKLHELKVFDGGLYPMNSVRINAYRPGQGIYPHCDGPVYYPKVAILSMGSSCVLSLYPRSGNEDTMKWDRANDVPAGHVRGSSPQVSLFLEPRSLLVFDKDAFWHHRHGIEATAVDELDASVCNLEAVGREAGSSIARSRRVSLTMRHLLPRCSWPYCGCEAGSSAA